MVDDYHFKQHISMLDSDKTKNRDNKLNRIVLNRLSHKNFKILWLKLLHFVHFIFDYFRTFLLSFSSIKFM